MPYVMVKRSVIDGGGVENSVLRSCLGRRAARLDQPEVFVLEAGDVVVPNLFGLLSVEQ